MVAKRNLKRIPRQPDLLIAYTIQPVMFIVLFVYVFGGAISTPGYDYVDFLMPGSSPSRSRSAASSPRSGSTRISARA